MFVNNINVNTTKLKFEFIREWRGLINRTRLKDISDLTGFSVNTVSLALNNSSRISEDTKIKILACAKEINYVPNNLARSLVKRENKVIGVILRRLDSHVFIKMAARIEEYLRERGYMLIIMSSRDDVMREIDSLLSQQVSGVLVMPNFTQANIENLLNLRRNNFPVVLLSHEEEAAGIDAVFHDRQRGAYKAVEFLARLNHKRIALIAPRAETMRVAGFMEAVKDYGCDYDERFFIDVKRTSIENGYKAMEELRRRQLGATAVFASNDLYAIGALKWCADNGVKVPEELSVMGYDNIEFSAYASVPLTTVSYSVEDVTNGAMELLFKLIEARHFSNMKPVCVKLEPEIIVRDSCAAAKIY